MAEGLVPKAVWPLAAELGEGPVWVARDGAIWFVDIKAPGIRRFDPATGRGSCWPAPDHVGFALPVAGGGFVTGLSDGLHRFDPADGRFARHAVVEPDLPGNRLNDATVDPTGRLWFGTMDNAEQAASGALYRLDDGRQATRIGAACAITNGPAFSPDGRTLYHVDTLAGRIDAFDCDARGDLSNRRLFAAIDPCDGYPDGVSVDSAGHVWVGLYGGWAARRYAPDGTLALTVRFPVANVTKIAFGGADLSTAYATTARQGLSEAARAAQPLAGALFAFAADVPGLPVPEARIA